MGWNRVSAETGLTPPSPLPGHSTARLFGGIAPKIVRAALAVPADRYSFNEPSILGATVGTEENPIPWKSEARVREKAEVGGGGARTRPEVLTTAANDGAVVEVNVKRRDGEMEVCGLDAEETFEEDGMNVEEAGEPCRPPLGAVITSGAHRLLALFDVAAAQHEAQVVDCATGSVFVSPSWAAPEIAKEWDALNPYSVSIPPQRRNRGHGAEEGRPDRVARHSPSVLRAALEAMLPVCSRPLRPPCRVQEGSLGPRTRNVSGPRGPREVREARLGAVDSSKGRRRGGLRRSRLPPRDRAVRADDSRAAPASSQHRGDALRRLKAAILAGGGACFGPP